MDLVSKTPLLNPKKLNLFMHQAKINKRIDDLKKEISQHIQSTTMSYILFRHSTLYYFEKNNIIKIESTKDRYHEKDYLRFDGHKVTLIDPEFYLGPIDEKKPYSWEYEVGQTDERYSNNNNNNNNNNGNNNG